MMEPAARGESVPRAYLHIGGMTLARHQLRLALVMECQRVVCIAREVVPELIELQHVAEAAGAQFHIVSGARGLAGLVTANDELLVLAEGLLADPLAAKSLLEGSHAVLVQPVEIGLPTGFERIDLNHATAGAMRVPGRLAEKLLDLPPDCDVPSALTRIALQAGISMREVPAASREGARWRLVSGEDDVHALEKEWIGLHLGKLKASSPGMFLSRVGVMSFGASLLHAGKGSKLALIAGAVVMLIALGSGWLGANVIAFVFCAIAWTLLCAAGMLHEVEAASLEVDGWFTIGKLLQFLLDLELVLLVVLAVGPPLWGISLAALVFPPLILVILARLFANISDYKWSTWVRDRAVLALILALATGFGIVMEAAQAISLVLGLAALFFTGAKARI